MKEKCCTIGIQLEKEVRAALEVCIKNTNVYVNYFDHEGRTVQHTSYHASGQTHTKKNGDYICWKGGPSGHWEPMKLFKVKPDEVRSRQDVSVIGWEMGSIGTVLPRLQTDIVFDISPKSDFSIVGFKTTIVGPEGVDRDNILGFPVLGRCQFSNGVTVEIEMFGLNQEMAEKPYGEDDF